MKLVRQVRTSMVACLLALLVAGLIGPAPAQARPAGKITADCTAKVTKFYDAGTTVIVHLTVKCNVLAPIINVTGAFGRYKMSGGVQAQGDGKQRSCYDTAKCTQILGLSDPKGDQRFIVGFDPEGTYVSWPDPTEIPGYTINKSSSADCPAMGCIGKSKVF